MIPEVFTIKAIKRPLSLLAVPNLNILVRKSKEDENLWIGRCLDLRITVQSRKTTYEEIKEEIFSDVTHIAMIMILRHLDNNTIDTLFNCSVESTEDWQALSDYNNKKKIEHLKTSYLKLQQGKSLQFKFILTIAKVLSIRKKIENFFKNLEDNTDEKTSVPTYDIQNLAHYSLR